MSEKIHENKEAAKEACEIYSILVFDLQKQHGVWEENGDSCVTTYICAKYFDENGKIQTFCMP